MKITPFLAAACGAVIATASSAASLNVMPGLWEMTSTGQTRGAPPIPPEYLARMTPDQRAMREQRVKASMAKASQPRVNRQCVTAQDLQRGFDIQDEARKGSDTAGCQKMVTTNSAATMDVKQTCTGGGQNTTMMIHFEASSPQSITGHVEVTMSGTGNAMKVTRDITGKWLGADCGAVKGN